MRLFKTACPVRPDEQAWVEEQLDWLVDEFGDNLLRAPMVLPTDEFFPGVYTGSAGDVRQIVELVRVRMRVDAGTFVVELADADDLDGALIDNLPGFRASSGAAGEYRRTNGGGGIISISMLQASAPMALVATIAHEFCHHRLLGEDRVQADRRDNEPLTDLASVFFGFGIFTANAALEFRPTTRVDSSGRQLAGWRSSRLGYLTEPMFGYALAYWALLRGDHDAAWARHLDTNPRASLKKGLQYLRMR